MEVPETPPEKINVEAIYAAPFLNDRSNGPRDGMEKSYDEIVNLLTKMGKEHDDFVYRVSMVAASRFGSS